jgi:hypothetical protein
MRTIYDASFTGLDISDTVELLEFAVPDQNMSVISMISLNNLCGEVGEYDSKLYIDNHLAVPDRKVLNASGNTSISLQSRDISIYQGAVVKITLKGLVADTNVGGRLLLLDSSVFTLQELESLINEITPQLISQVVAAVKGINITVKPETKLLGPCKEPIVPSVKVLNQCSGSR